MSWGNVTLSIAGKEHMHLPAFDFTKLSAINTCPTWGILRYTHHKSMYASQRAVALDAGKAMHDCFAAIRLVQLGQTQGLYAHMQYHGARLFGASRWDSMMQYYNSDEDVAENIKRVALECLSTSAFVEDPDDTKRTFNNLENSLLYYCQRWEADRYPVWCADESDPTSFVGIEVPFAILVQPENYLPFLYTGRVDGLHTDRGKALLIQENKTATRLNQAWRQSFIMSHQVTGYSVAGSLFAKQHVARGLVIGIQIPVSRNVYDSYAMEEVQRPTYMREAWLKWLEHTIVLHDTYKDQVTEAPRYTHSCNRYFRPCSMIPFCASDKDEQELMFEQMHTDEWSPLHEQETGD